MGEAPGPYTAYSEGDGVPAAPTDRVRSHRVANDTMRSHRLANVQ